MNYHKQNIVCLKDTYSLICIIYPVTMCVGYHSVIFSLHSDFLHYSHVLLANLQLNVMTLLQQNSLEHCLS